LRPGARAGRPRAHLGAHHRGGPGTGDPDARRHGQEPRRIRRAEGGTMSNGKQREPTWNEASCELEEILQEIESGSTDLDALHQRVERAAELIQLCRDKLGSTELKVRKVVDALAGVPGDGRAGEAPPADEEA